ncbi:hypothetical protein BCON_0141g00210 [Botryotinia convoluta]|uniref:Uncharacterized protein n=1 Tax=Botryotinia convoluta TaxID=54673 RepID=A0A4Z1HTJ5_9HELO|nr:hypothetical protein BCON_0141g00210 [Botryotinia convoluta]
MAFVGSAISKIVASVATLQNETTFALSSLNQDFTLIKLEAPREYKNVGESISSARKHNAETGGLHKTARKVGALFDGKAPLAPELFRAYGTRVSELCEIERLNPTGKSRHGLISNHVGADSTSIWAAVTSGDGAIAVHLLACMIARIFTGPQAISLWMALIEKRKEEIEEGIANTTDQVKAIAAACAAQQEIRQEEIADWDSSARSWIQSADLVKLKEQSRAMLMTDSSSLEVNSESDTYRSVMQGWKDVMIAMNNLVTGIPQRVESGAALLGMTSWHLNPDMIVLQKRTELIKQRDDLVVDTGILTVGLHTAGESQGSVSWSLPLAHMRYYGTPVRTSRQIGVESTRISMDHFGYILLGSVFSTWHQFAPNGIKGMEWILKILETLRQTEHNSGTDSSTLMRIQKLTDRSSWIGQLLSAAEQYQFADDIEQGIARKSPLAYLWPLRDAYAFPLLSDSEARVAYFRDFAKELELSNEHGVIHYRHTENGITIDEYTTIDTVKRDLWIESTGYVRRHGPPGLPSLGKHVRWIPIASRPDPPCKCKGTCIPPKKSALTSAKSIKPGCPCWNIGGCSIACHDWKKVSYETCGSWHGGLLIKRSKLFQLMGEKCLPVHMSTDISDPRYSLVDFGNGSDFQSSLIELYRDKGADFDHSRFTEWFASTLRSKGHKGYLTSLRACASAAEIYTRLPDATIESKIVEQSLTTARWIPITETTSISPLRLMLSRTQVFACIAMFESGTFNLDPEGLKEIFVISSGNSIFVASPLLCDPYEQPTGVEIQSVPGNIGYPGLSLLIPPPNPRILKSGVDIWQHLDYKPFRGVLEDNLLGTSIRLSFSGYEMPLQQSLDMNKDGHIIDRPVRLVEAIEYSIIFEEDRLVTADNWDDILTLNGGSLSVVRATGNWLARLAATVINVQAQRSTILVPKDVCWTCLKEHLQRKDFGVGHEKVLIAQVISSGLIGNGEEIASNLMPPGDESSSSNFGNGEKCDSMV